MIHHNGVVLEYEIIANVFNGNKVSLMKLLEKKACTVIIILLIILRARIMHIIDSKCRRRCILLAK